MLDCNVTSAAARAVASAVMLDCSVVSAAAKSAATIKAYEGAIKNYETAITTKTRITSASGTITRSITRIQTARTQALAAYEGAKRDVVDGLDMTKLICTNGF